MLFRLFPATPLLRVMNAWCNYMQIPEEEVELGYSSKEDGFGQVATADIRVLPDDTVPVLEPDFEHKNEIQLNVRPHFRRTLPVGQLLLCGGRHVDANEN